MFVLSVLGAQERFARKNEADDLRRAFQTLDKKGDQKIDGDELNQVFMALGHKTKRVRSARWGGFPYDTKELCRESMEGTQREGSAENATAFFVGLKQMIDGNTLGLV